MCATLFHLVCVACWLGFGRGRPGGGRLYPTHPSQPASQPATHTNVFAFVCCCCFTYILLYIYAPHHRQTDRDRSISVYSLSLSIHSLGSCCLHTLAPTTTRLASCVCVCVYVCAFGSLSSNASDVPITGHVYIDRGAEDKQQAHTATTQTHHDALLGACCVCVYVLVCPAAKLPSEVDGSKYVPSRRRPPAATRAAGRQACRTGTHLPTMLL